MNRLILSNKNSVKLPPALCESLPIDLWKAAYGQAERSDVQSYKTGAVIFNEDNDIIGKGCSHRNLLSGYNSVHAEEAALTNCNRPHNKLDDNSIVILSITRAGNPSYCSKPCYRCLTTLVKTGLRYIFWPERDNAGNWTVCCESPDYMFDRAVLSDVRVCDFARHMRL